MGLAIRSAVLELRTTNSSDASRPLCIASSMSSDVVPRVPPGAGMIILVGIAKAISWATSFLPVASSLFDKVEEFLDKLSGYRHYGDLRYLSDVGEGRFQDVRLLFNPPLIDRVVWMWRRLGKEFVCANKESQHEHLPPKNLCILRMIGMGRKLLCCNAPGFLVCTVIVITRQFPCQGWPVKRPSWSLLACFCLHVEALVRPRGLCARL